MLPKSNFLDYEKKKNELNLVHEAIWEIDTSGQVLYINTYGAKCLEYTPEEMIGQSFYKFMDERGQKIAHEKLERRKLGEAEVHPFEFQSKSGQGVWLNVQAKPIVDAQGKVTSVFASMTDITELKRKEDNLNALIESLDDIVMEVDDEFKFRNIWTAREELLFLPREQLINRPILEIWPNELGKIFYDSIDFVFSKKQTKQIEYQLPGLQHQKWFSARISANRGNQKTVSVLISDITEKKKLEAMSLHSTRMISLGEMASGVAHEINNPLTIILGKANQLRKKIEQKIAFDPQKFISELEKIEHHAGRIAKIVGALRSFSRNSEEDPFLKVPVIKIFDETLEFCKERFKNQNIKLELDFNSEELARIFVFARENQLIQVVLNLLNNSLDAMIDFHAVNKEKPWVRIGAKFFHKSSNESPYDYVLIEVVDAGFGIAPEIVEKMMQPFFTTKVVGKGTGLGLSISSGIIDEHEGELYYDPKSKNTRFVVRLPASKVE